MDLQEKINDYERKVEKKTCTTKEFAEILGISENKARQLMRIPGAPVIKLGRNKRVVLSKIDAFIDTLIGEDIF